MPTHERRRYRRIRAPLYCRPAGMQFLARQQQAVDVSLGGVRIYSDDPLKVGELLKMEFFLPDTKPVTYTAEIVRVEELPPGSPARYDVGLKFLHLEPAALSLLVSVLGPLEDPIEDPSAPPASVPGKAAAPTSVQGKVAAPASVSGSKVAASASGTTPAGGANSDGSDEAGDSNMGDHGQNDSG